MLSTITVEPLYEKVKKQLLTYIDEEKPQVLPREKDLISLFGVSRNTVRRAVQDLSNAGVLMPKQGHGTVVLKYAEDKICDIGVICTDSLDVTEPWIATMLKTLRQTAHAEGYHLNLFFCHDYSINTSNNSAYSYLVNSGKLAGLVLMSALNHADVSHIKSIGLPVVTIDFRYRDFDYPAFIPDCMTSISDFIDEYIKDDITQFGVIAKWTKGLDEVDCHGINGLIIENWKNMLLSKNLSVLQSDFSVNIVTQIRAMYSLPPEQRPQVIFTPFIAYGAEVEAVLRELVDWNPIHIVTEIKGYETGVPAIIVDPAEHARKAMALLDKMIVDNRHIETVSRQVTPTYNSAQLAGVAV